MRVPRPARMRPAARAGAAGAAPEITQHSSIFKHSPLARSCLREVPLCVLIMSVQNLQKSLWRNCIHVRHSHEILGRVPAFRLHVSPPSTDAS